MNIVELQAEVVRLKDASIFRYGDPNTFAVRLLPDEVELPGPSNPALYLKLFGNKLGVSLPKDAHVAVVGAGNCGLVAEALNAGATKVIAIEPRARFKPATDHICSMLRSCYPDADISTFLGWPGDSADLGPLDMILWPEGLDETPTPLDHARSLLKLLKPVGLLIVEVPHGSVTTFGGRVNSFRPTAECWAGLVKHLGAKSEASAPGRTGSSTLYKIGRGLVVSGEPMAPAASQLPAFPKPVPVKKVTPMPPNPENFGGPAPKATEALPKRKPAPAPPKPPEAVKAPTPSKPTPSKPTPSKPAPSKPAPTAADLADTDVPD